MLTIKKKILLSIFLKYNPTLCFFPNYKTLLFHVSKGKATANHEQLYNSVIRSATKRKG